MALFSSPSTAHVASDASGEGGDGGEDGGEPASSAQCARTAASARARAACHSSGSKPDAPRCALELREHRVKAQVPHAHARRRPRQRFTQLCWPDLEQSPREHAFPAAGRPQSSTSAPRLVWRRRLDGDSEEDAAAAPPFPSMSRRERFSRGRRAGVMEEEADVVWRTRRRRWVLTLASCD